MTAQSFNANHRPTASQSWSIITCMAYISIDSNAKNIANTGSFVSQGSIDHLSSHLHQIPHQQQHQTLRHYTSSSSTSSLAFSSRYGARSAQSGGVRYRMAYLALQVPVAAQEERQTGEQEARWPRIAGHQTRTTFLSLRPLHHRATAISSISSISS